MPNQAAAFRAWRNSLREQTTYAPVLLLRDFTQTTTLAPVVHRDVDTPDLGYHCDPLDYVWSGLNLTNTTLTLANGVAVGVYGSRGLVLRHGANLVGAGLPRALSRLVSYTAVWENPLIWGDAPLAPLLVLTLEPSGDTVVVNEGSLSGTSSLLLFHWDGNDLNIRQTGDLSDGSTHFELEGLTFAPLNLP